MCSIETAGHDEPAVAVTGLTRRFGARTAIAGLSLSVAKGQVSGLIGANGGGKTTSLRMLAGLLKPDAGAGRVLGHDLTLADRSIRHDVGYMAQRLALYPSLSVLDNLRFRAEVYGVVNAVESARRIVADYGLAAYASVPAERLSGGWARLVQLAAALIHAPRLVLLDEPTAGLDAAARQAVWRRIASLAGAGVAVVIATHDLAEAERCSHVSVLAGGRVRAQGAPLAIARGSAARVHALAGAAAIALADRIAALPGVVAAYPAAGDLRVVTIQAAGAAVAALARAAGCDVDAREPTLEDATLVLAHQGFERAVVTHQVGAMLRRILAIGRIETLFICGDRATLGLILLVPAIQIALFGYAVNFNPRDVPIAIARAVAEPQSALSAAIDETGYFRVVADGLANGAAEQLVRSRRALVGVELGEPAASDDAWTSGARSPRLIVDASEPSAVRPAVLALQSAWVRRTLGVDGGAVLVDWLYNPDGKTAWSLVPGLAGVVVMISALLLGALTLVRERERGTWEALLVTPVRPGEALLGKLAPYVLLGVLQAGVVVALGHALFDVPVRGSVALLLAASALFAGAHLTLGFALSALAQTQVQAVQAAVLFYLPSMVLSGFMFPFEGMPRWARALGEALPLTHFVRVARGVLLRGAGGAEIAAELMPVLLFLLASTALALVVYRRRLD